MANPTRFNLSASQYTPEGAVVGDLLYGGIVSSLFTREEYSGGPHDGGSHTLRLYTSQKNFEAFLDLVEEIYLPRGGKYAEGVIALRRTAMTRDKWRRLTDAELKSAIRIICNKCMSADEVNKMAKEELDYPYNIAVTYGSRDMFMAMFYGKRGNTLNL